MAVNYLAGMAFMSIVLLILFIKVTEDLKQEKMKRMYQVLLIVVGLYVLLDAGFAVGFLTGENQVPGFQIVIFLFFVIYVITPYVWLLFVRSYVRIPHNRIFRVMEKIPLMILLSMVIISVPTGYVWYISKVGDYVRGPGFQLFTAINLFYYLEVFANGLYSFSKEKYRKSPYLLNSLILSTIPLAAILINTYLIPLQMTYPFQPFCLVLGALFAYLFMTDRQNSLQEEAYNANLKQALELEKEASHQAIEAGKVKSIFLANMSHDIRTPINAILGFAQIIEQDPRDEARVKNAVEKIKSSGTVLLNLINDVLDFTKIENNKLQLDNKSANLNELMQGIEELFDPIMKQEELNFKVRQNLCHTDVYCDVGKLQRILVNVINNAVKFTPGGGRILFAITEKTVEKDTGKYEFVIQDTGIGIEPELQARIFEAFEQGNNSTVHGGSGSGLGLAIVKQLVELMNGALDIESAAGEGTKIKITFAFSILENNENYMQPERAQTDTDLSDIQVLLVEDNALNREIAQEMLEGRGMEVTWAANGKEAVEYFESKPEHTFDIILMDIMMPVMDGLEAARQIRAMERSDAAEIPIIALTANAFSEDVQKSKEAGINEHLSKPLQYDVLVEKIAGYVKNTKLL